MKKLKDDSRIKDLIADRQGIRNRLYDRFFNLFASSLEWEGFTREEREAIIKSLWNKGTISAFRISDELLAFTSYTPNEFNFYGTPVGATPLPGRSAPYIPTRVLKTGAVRINQARGVDEPEIILGWAQHTLKPIKYSLADWIDDLVETEIAIRMNANLQKVPFILKTNLQNESKLSNLVERMILGSPAVSLGVDEVDSVDALSTGAPYLLDKLEERKDHLEKEVLTFLGIDNLKEKPERMQGDEINANNDEININRDAILDNVKEWISMVNEAFGTNYRVDAKASARSLYEEPKEEKDENPEPSQNRME